ALRGRVSALESVFIRGSNELGAFESGVAAALIGAVSAVVLGGIASMAVAILWCLWFPSLRHVDRFEDLPDPTAAETTRAAARLRCGIGVLHVTNGLSARARILDAGVAGPVISWDD